MSDRILRADTFEPPHMQSEEYLRRNLLHCKACGVAAGISAAIERLKAKAKTPKWLMTILENELAKAYAVANEMAKHRDEEWTDDPNPIKGQLRVPQTPTTGIGAIIGKWPGNETDEEINEALERLS